VHVHYWLSGIGLLVFVSGLVVNRFRKNAERKGRVKKWPAWLEPF
jgi:hypothetical protein